MTDREIKQRVRTFQKEFGPDLSSYEGLQNAVEKQGFTVIEFNPLASDSDMQTLIDVLNISKNISSSKGFTYADRNRRLVFIHDELSEAEKTYVLAHEAAHIYLGHISAKTVIGRDVQEEYEANEFSHFLLKKSAPSKLSAWISRHKIAVICATVALILVAAGIFAAVKIGTESKYHGDYYITATGSKYHRKECIFVKGKDNARRMTEEEFESGEYGPCQTCLPD